jgi:hypothetical protein
MKKLKQYWTAEALEKDLGDPLNPDNPLSHKRVIEINESEEFPHEEIRWLYDWRLQHYYIPTDCGGENSPPLRNLSLLCGYCLDGIKLLVSLLLPYSGHF